MVLKYLCTLLLMVRRMVNNLFPIRIKLQIGSDVVFEQKIESNLETIEISIGLNSQSFLLNENLLFAIGVQIYWDSNGSSSDAVIMFEEITLDGITFTEWDEDPNCLSIDDIIGNNSFNDEIPLHKKHGRTAIEWHLTLCCLGAACNKPICPP